MSINASSASFTCALRSFVARPAQTAASPGMSDGTPFLRVAADRIGAPGSARIAGKNAIPRHHRRQLVLTHPDRREDGCHSKANWTSSGFEPHSTGWEGSIWGIPVDARWLESGRRFWQ